MQRRHRNGSLGFARLIFRIGLLVLVARLTTVVGAQDAQQSNGPLSVYPADGVAECNPRTPILVKYPDAEDLNIDSLKVVLDGKDLSQKVARFERGAIYVPDAGLSVGPHNVQAKIADTAGRLFSIQALFSIVHEQAPRTTVEFNTPPNTAIPEGQEIWLQGTCNHTNIAATVSVNFGPELQMDTRVTTFGSFIDVPRPGIVVVTLSNRVTQAHWTFLPLKQQFSDQ